MTTNSNKNITARKINFAKWYTDVIKQGQLCDYGAENGSAAGTIIFCPRGYAIWENIQLLLNEQFKKKGITNVMLPLLISEKAFQAEKEHIEGFTPECALVTHVGANKLPEPLIIRPTSEVLFGRHFAKIISSYKQLPLLYNQWCNVVRWEKTTRPFLRTSEFLWQEGHTAHNNEAQARAFTLEMINLYAQFVEQYLAIKVIIGAKTAFERFAGAQETYTIETMMQDGQALQAGTSHYFGQEFAKVFNIKFSNKDNKQEWAYQTSWGVSTRLIGALIMAHSDDLGLVLPPTIAPQQIMILNLAPTNSDITNMANKLATLLLPHFRVIINDDDKSFSFKKSDSQIKGIPLIITVGKQEMTAQVINITLRHNSETVSLPYHDNSDNKELISTIANLLQQVTSDLFANSETKLANSIKEVTTFSEYQKLLATHKGFFLAPFCNQITCEQEIKTLTSTTSRCIPLVAPKAATICFKCGAKNSAWTYFARAY